ncbi:hypothetical protein KBB76_02040 [Candidatus Saccharibacteria bacterium]|jgi:hypothetical protein|nr:hypothetical protein [Candidatus Saccharibacteria bacterium]HOR23382.1 pilin [Candidatus Saccharibacteria bacterium]
MTRKVVLVLIALFCALFIGLEPVYAAGDYGKREACNKSKSPLCENVGTNKNAITDLIGRVSTFLALMGGTVAVILVIYGGFRYVVSGGDANKVTTAKNTILYGVIGLVVIAAAQAIVIFFLNTVAKS